MMGAWDLEQTGPSAARSFVTTSNPGTDFSGPGGAAGWDVTSGSDAANYQATISWPESRFWIDLLKTLVFAPLVALGLEVSLRSRRPSGS